MATSFDETRARPWEGWQNLLPYLSKTQAVLDLGCGNGRFGIFLAEKLSQKITYTGIDNNPFLLDRARESLTEAKMEFNLLNQDLLGDFKIPESHDLIVLFGVMHHIPAFENRRKLLQKCLSKLSPNGYLVVTLWAFYENDRLRKKITPWEETEYKNLPLEKNDYLLDWKRDGTALRYCHYVDPAEQEKLTAGMKVVKVFDADNSNRYVVLGT